jgi:PAS domain S-box-containing protein
VARRSRRAGVWLALILAGPLLVFGLTSFTRRITAVEPHVGVEWVQSSTGPVALSVDPTSPAGLAGVLAGDVLIEISGTAVSSALEASELAWRGAEGGAVPLVLSRGGERLELIVEPQWSPRQEPYLYLAIVGLAFWVSGLFIGLKWPMIRGGAIYALLAQCMFAQLILSHTGDADRLDRLIYWADMLAGVLAPALLLHLGIVLSKGVVRRRRLAVAVVYFLAVSAVLIAVWVRPEIAGGSYRFNDPLLAVEARERLDPLLLAVCWLLTTGLLVKSYNNSSSIPHRSQMRWLLWGLTVGLGPFVLLYAVPWAVGAPELPDWAGFLSVAPIVVVPGAFTAALARYRLHDLDLILLRGISEVSAVFGTFAVLAAAIFILREGVAELLPISRSGTRYIGFFFAAISYPKMRSWARVGVERAFYRKRYSYRTTLLDWARELNADTDLSSLLERLRERVRDTLGIPHVAVLLRTGATSFEAVDVDVGSGIDGANRSEYVDQRPLELDAAEIERLERAPYLGFDAGRLRSLPWVSYLFPMRVKGSLRAVLAIAERRHPEEPLSTEDRELLGTLSAHAATAIEAARLFQEVRNRVEEIERLHSRQAKILESSAVGLLLLDGDGQIQAWNRALEAIYGMEREEAVGRRLNEVFPLQVVRRLEREVGSSVAGEEARIFRLGMVNNQGNRILVNISISPVGGDEDGDGARVVTFDDVTERVKLEEQVLRQERLASLGLLAAGVAHEINTPLTGISSYTQMLMDDTGPEDRRTRVLQKIEQQTRRAAGITSSLLNLARPERASLESLDLNQVISEVLQLFEPQVRRTGIRVRAALADELPVVSGNKGKLQQVVLNLLINARDALGDHGNVTIVSYRKDGDVVVEVTDDGMGIAEEDLPRIFDPFFTTKGRGKGTGLGLSICYGIVQEHNGEIHVESSVGQYTRFRVELPAIGSAKALA